MPGSTGDGTAMTSSRPSALQRRPAGLAYREAGVVAMQQGCAPGREQDRRVMAHRRLFGDEGQPVAAVIERESPGRHLDHVGYPGRREAIAEVR